MQRDAASPPTTSLAMGVHKDGAVCLCGGGLGAPQRLGGAANGGDLGPVASDRHRSGVFCDSFWE